MWYRLAKEKSVWSVYDGKMLMVMAENSVRELLYLRGDYSPDRKQVNAYAGKVLKNLEERFGNSDKLRISLPGEELTPAVKAAAREVLG